MKWIAWIASVFYRDADFVIGGKQNPYMLRWYVIPRNRFFNVYLHKIVRDDDDRALHDHPWPSLSVMLSGCYREYTKRGRRLISSGMVTVRSPEHAHRLECVDGKPCWTLFITGPRCREWGFHCPKGWVSWQDFTDSASYGNVGKGCGEMA